LEHFGNLPDPKNKRQPIRLEALDRWISVLRKLLVKGQGFFI